MDMKRLFASVFILSLSTVLMAQQAIDLSGQWNFKTGGDDIPAEFVETVSLPGSMLVNGKGDEITDKTPWMMSINEGNPYYTDSYYARYRQPGNVKIPFTLQPEKYYQGIAWYQREIVIPAKFRNHVIKLFMERCHWETEVYVDGRKAGSRNDLCSPQEYDLTGYLAPGRHVLSIKVDNRIKDIDPGINSHSISDNTQGNWNGIAGAVELRILPKIYIDRVDVFPHISGKDMDVRMTVVNSDSETQDAVIRIGGKKLRMRLSPGVREVEETVQLPSDLRLWDEFHPNLYTLPVSVTVNGKTDKRTVTYGCREWTTDDGNLMLNGHRVFLRGNVDCCTFPLTGYPPFDKKEWQRIFQVYKDYGLNHVRFHSWCPPEAAFEVADEMGIYCYVECSSWANQSTTIGDGKGIDGFIYQEAENIVKAYGNHPSFCMMSYGNEPGGKNSTEYLRKFVNYWKSKDNRRLYTAGAGWPNIAESDWLSDPKPRIQRWAEGLKSIINSQEPSTSYDWSDYSGQFSQPIVSHEIGQWCVYPDFHEIEKYTGGYKARNFEIFRDRLNENGLGEYADSFHLASGKLQTICYKADIEAALRTGRFGGFELLGLNDFSGQGTALVGVVDVFWDSKKYVSGSEYRKFCNYLVPLARMDRLIYQADEDFNADIEVANFYRPCNDVCTWSVKNSGGKVIKSGRFPEKQLEIGNCQKIGQIVFPLAEMPGLGRYTLEVRIGEFVNDWNFWVYPTQTIPVQRTAGGGEIMITDALSPEVADYLRSGGKVLLSLGRDKVKKGFGGEVEAGFSSIFWNTLWTNNCPPHTLGILCDPSHPALRSFPTEYYSDFQWQDPMKNAAAIRYDKIDKDIKPIVRIIDDWFTARPLALIFEVRVGRGVLVVSGVDLIHNIDNRLSSRQLLLSLSDYVKSSACNPSVEVDLKDIQKILQ